MRWSPWRRPSDPVFSGTVFFFATLLFTWAHHPVYAGLFLVLSVGCYLYALAWYDTRKDRRP